MNSMMVIFPYNLSGIWVFDDSTVGLLREPFVGDVNEMINHVSASIPEARSGFALFFSATPFPGCQMKLVWLRSDGAQGNFYFSPDLNKEGWLCPALLKYFLTPPPEIYIKAEPKR